MPKVDVQDPVALERNARFEKLLGQKLPTFSSTINDIKNWNPAQEWNQNVQNALFGVGNIVKNVGHAVTNPIEHLQNLRAPTPEELAMAFNPSHMPNVGMAGMTKPVEHKMLQGLYRGYAGEGAPSETLFATPQKKVADYYSLKRAEQTGETPRTEMLLVDPAAGKAYGHSTRGTGGQEPMFTRARKLTPEMIEQSTQLTPTRDQNLTDFNKNSKEKGDWYHGTAHDVTEFKPELGLEKPNQAGAAFLTQSPEYAEKYALDAPIYMAKEAHKYLTPEQMASAQEKAKQYFKETYKDMPEHRDSMIKSIEEGKAVGEAEDQLIAEYQKHLPSGPNIMKVRLNVENPFDPAVPEHVEAHKVFNPKLDPKLTDRIGVTAVLEHPDIQAAIKGSGFDSFYTNEDGYRNIGVFDPTRIKSAIGNEGTFDPTNPVITKKDGGSVTVEDPVLIERKLKLMGLI